MELLDNFPARPAQYVRLPRWAAGKPRRICSTRRSMQGRAGTLDNADDLANLSKAFVTCLQAVA